MTRRFPLGLVPIVAGLALAACSQARPARIGAADTNCTRCHGQPPDTDAHAVHSGGGALKRTFDCVQCHKKPHNVNDPDHILRANGDPVPPPAEVRFDEAGSIAGDTEPGGARSDAPRYDATARTCSNVYCHGATLLGATGNLVPQPNWGTKGQVVCGSCHGIPPADAPHGTVTPGDRTACVRCHVGAIDAQGQPNSLLHVNGHVDVPTDAGCNRCHGRVDLAEAVAPGDARSAPPVDLLGQTTSTAVGAHQAHLTGTDLRSTPIACADCHPVPSPSALIQGQHLDGNVDVPFGALAKSFGADASYDFGNQTCSNVYCHGAFVNGNRAAPSWTGGASELQCDRCHGTPPPAPHPPIATCGDCHPGYDTGVANKDVHINGRLDLK